MIRLRRTRGALQGNRKGKGKTSKHDSFYRK
jgi:hypothetical protein